MQINEPQIVIDEIMLPEKCDMTEKFEICKYYSEFFDVIDGFEKEGNPCIKIIN